MIAAFIQEEDHARLTTAMTRLQQHGVLLPPAPAAPPAALDSAPIPLQETPLSEVIIEERR